jgi:integrase
MTKRRSPGDGALFKRGDGLWAGSVEVPSTDGKRRQKRVYSKDRGTALAKLRELRAQIDAGQIPTTSTTTVAKWLDHWLETIAKPDIRPMTYRSYEQVIRLYIAPHIGSKRLDRLTAEHIRVMHRAIQERSHRFAQLAHSVLRKALKQAMTEGLILRNPLDAVKPPKYVPTVRAAFTAETAAHIIKTAFLSGDEIQGTRWAAAFLTGARRSELLGLEWDRVNLVDGYIDLAWQLQRLPRDWQPEAGVEARQCHGTLWWTRPKSNAGTRVVPLIAPMVAALERVKELDGANPHGLVWHHPDGRPITPEEHHDDWKQLLSDAGVPDAPLHSCRHTTATMLHAAGVDEDTRQLVLGHSSAVVTRGYVHVDRSRQLAALDNLGGLMPSAAPDTPDPQTDFPDFSGDDWMQ